MDERSKAALHAAARQFTEDARNRDGSFTLTEEAMDNIDQAIHFGVVCGSYLAQAVARLHELDPESPVIGKAIKLFASHPGGQTMLTLKKTFFTDEVQA